VRAIAKPAGMLSDQVSRFKLATQFQNVIDFPKALFGSVNLYTLTANDRHRLDRLGEPSGAYFIAGDG
jgi:hypothetical protein